MRVISHPSSFPPVTLTPSNSPEVRVAAELERPVGRGRRSQNRLAKIVLRNELARRAQAHHLGDALVAHAIEIVAGKNGPVSRTRQRISPLAASAHERAGALLIV